MATTLPATTFAHASETIDLGDVSSLLRRRAGTIGIFVVGATIFAVIHVLLATPQFTAHGAMYLGDAGAAQPTSNADNLNFLTDYASQSDVNTQIELITAGALVQRVVLETGMNARVTPADTPPMTYWRWRFLNGGRTDAFAPGPDTVQVLYATTPGNYRLELGKDGTYTLSTRGNWFTASRFVLHGVLGKPASGNGVQMLAEGALPNFAPVPGKKYDVSITSPAALAEDISGGALAVSAGGSVEQPTKIAFLQLRWYNPYQAQAFVNQMMQDYIATQLSWKTESASTTENFVSGQLANVSAALASADQKLANYQSKTGIVDVPENAQSMISQLAQYETQRTTLQLQREALQQLNNEIQNSQGPLNPNPYLISQVNDTVLANLTSNLSDAETKLNQLRVQYTPYAVEVRMQNAQVERMEESIRSIVRNDLTAANKNLAGLNGIIDHLQSTIKEMPAESLRVISLKRSTDVLGQLYVLLMEKEEQARVSKAATIINTRIVTPAITPLFVTSPKAVINIVFGALAGLVVGAGLVFGQRAMSGRYETEEQVRSAVRLPVYGTVPRQLKSELGTNVFGQEQRNPFSESFRLLRRSIYRNSTAGKTMVILIISASKDDGKTTIAVNLAKSLADDGKNVVMMDGDLHLSRLHEMLNLTSTVGLTDCLETSAELPIQDCPDENFKVLAAGSAPLHGKQHFNEKTLAPVFANLSGKFDYVVVDSPPLPTVSDGMIFGSFADLVLTVVSVSHTPKRTLSIHNELIETLDRPHGIIINEVEGQVMGEGDAYFMTETGRGAKIAGWLKRS
jgi:capsular exopolysaccharide synthesis family protein